jgi:hypothetical protein
MKKDMRMNERKEEIGRKKEEKKEEKIKKKEMRMNEKNKNIILLC